LIIQIILFILDVLQRVYCYRLYADPYVKIWRVYRGQRQEKKKTAIKEKTLNPVFNESFYFKVTQKQIPFTSIEVIVMDHDAIGQNQLIGTVLLSSMSGPNEVKHWNEMLDAKSEKPVTQWHVLR